MRPGPDESGPPASETAACVASTTAASAASPSALRAHSPSLRRHWRLPRGCAFWQIAGPLPYLTLGCVVASRSSVGEWLHQSGCHRPSAQGMTFESFTVGPDGAVEVGCGAWPRFELAQAAPCGALGLSQNGYGSSSDHIIFMSDLHPKRCLLNCSRD